MENNSYLKEFFKYTFANILGTVAISCYVLADTFFIARGTGSNGLAALNISIPVFNVINGTGMMLGIGSGAKYSVNSGSANQNEKNRIFTNALYLGAIFSAAYMLIGIFLSGWLAEVLGAQGEVYDMANIYIKVIMIFAPAFIFNNIFVAFVRNDMSPRLAMVGMITGSLSNIVLDYIFIFPFKMGILGAVLATAVAPVISMLIMSAHKIKGKNNFHLTKMMPDLKLSEKCCALGFPSLVTELSSGIVILVFNIIILRISGNIGVAAYGIVSNISIVVIAVFTGIAQGMQPLVSMAHGRKDFAAELKLFKYAICCAVLLFVVIYPVVYFFADPIALAFNSEGSEQLQSIAVTGLKIYFTGMLFAGINIVTSMFFTSAERALPAHIITLMRGLFVIIPAAFLLSSLLELTGVWLSFTATETIVFIVSVSAIVIFRAKHKKRLERKNKDY